MGLQIVGHPGSNFVRTVRMVAHEKGISYDSVPELPRSSMIRELHPLGQIPVMRHGDLDLFESAAIARYLDTAFDGPPLIPPEPEAAAVVNQWISFVQTSVDRLIMRQYVVEYLFHKDADGAVVRDEIDRAVRRFPKMYGILDQAVAGGFLGNAAFTMADCFLAPILASSRRYPEAAEALTASPALAGYFERISERASFRATKP